MKKTALIFLLALIGCSNDDDASPDSESFSLIAEWELIETLSGKIDPLPVKWEKVNAEDRFVYVFMADGNISASYLNCVGTYYFSTENEGEVLKMDFPCSDVNYSYIINNILTEPKYLVLDLWGDLARPEGASLKFRKKS